MLSAAFAIALLALFASITAVGLFSSPEKNLGKSMTSAQAVQALLPVTAMGSLLTAVASIYRQLHRAAAKAAGAGTEVAVWVMAVGVIQFFSFVLPAAHVDDGARALELGMAAAHVLPAAATTTFFLGVILLFVVHVRAGNRAAAAGDGPVQILIKVVVGATAVLVGLMALAL